MQKTLRATYQWVMNFATHPRSLWVLSGLAFCEAIFFPIPPDPLVAAMGAARPQRAIFYGAVTTFFSVLGGLGGYALGFFFWTSLDGFFFQYIIREATFTHMTLQFQQNALVTIFLAGLTPIPFKVFTLAGGVASLPLAPFVVGATLGRALRFLSIGVLLYFFGPRIREFIDQHLEKLSIVVGVIVVVLFVLIRYFG